jgi:hypothetical protein
MKISKEKFQAYEDIRETRITNMFAVDYITKLSVERGGEVLTRQDIFEIMVNYNLYKEKYLINNENNNND